MIDIVSPVTLLIEDLEITGGHGCVGGAVRAAVLTVCDPTGITAVPVDLTLRRVDIHDHTYDMGGGAVGITQGSTLLVEESNIYHNEGHGVYSLAADVHCVGRTDGRFGIWGNVKNGVYMQLADSADHTISGQDCDFGDGDDDNGNFDMSFLDLMNQDYGEDATFTCSSANLACL